MSELQSCLFVGCLLSQQQASVSQGRICSDSFTCCHIEIEVADQIFYLTRSQYTDTRPTIPALTLQYQVPGRVATWVPIFESLVWLDPKKSRRKQDSNPGSSTLEADALTTRPTRRWIAISTLVQPLVWRDIWGSILTELKLHLFLVYLLKDVPMCLANNDLWLPNKVSK